jgi:hypothetical protein
VLGLDEPESVYYNYTYTRVVRVCSV